MASNEGIEKEFDKWKLYHQVHGKSISELSPEINVILRKYAIKKLYELSQTYRFIKKKVDDFFKLIALKGQEAKIAKNFNADKYCIYEDYTNLIEKIYESAEDEFEVKILQNDFSNHLELIAVYRLLVDMIELVHIWKEKDENITKFQTFCKFRVIQIMEKKKNKKNANMFDCEIEREFKNLKEEIKQNEGENLVHANTSGQVGDQKVNKELSANELNFHELRTSNTMNVLSSRKNDLSRFPESITGVQNPYSAISLEFNQPQPNISVSEQKTQEQPQVIPLQYQAEMIPNIKSIQQSPIQPQLTMQQQQYYLQQQQYYQQQQLQQQQLQQQYQEQIIQHQYQTHPFNNFQHQDNFNQLPKPSSQNNQYHQTNIPSLPPSKNTQKPSKSVLNRKKIMNKNEQYIEEIERMKKELEHINDPSEEQKKKKEEQPQTQTPNKLEVKKKKEINLISTAFKQLSTPMLTEYTYDQERVKVTLPFKYQSNNYFGVIDYFKKTLIPTTIKEIQNNNYIKAFENSEDMLYCLTNILPK